MCVCCQVLCVPQVRHQCHHPCRRLFPLPQDHYYPLHNDTPLPLPQQHHTQPHLGIMQQGLHPVMCMRVAVGLGVLSLPLAVAHLLPCMRTPSLVLLLLLLIVTQVAQRVLMAWHSTIALVWCRGVSPAVNSYRATHMHTWAMPLLLPATQAGTPATRVMCLHMPCPLGTHMHMHMAVVAAAPCVVLAWDLVLVRVAWPVRLGQAAAAAGARSSH